MPSLRRHLFLLSLVWCLALPGLALAQAEGEVRLTEPQVEYLFGDQVTIRATILSETLIREATLFFRQAGQDHTQPAGVEISPSGEALTVHDLSRHPFRPFSTVHFWYRVTLEGGQTYTSPEFEFFYTDNRQEWHALAAGPFQVNWYAGDVTFAQEVLNVAMAGLARAQSFLQVQPPEVINVYVFDSVMELQSTLQLSGQHLVAGHADPQLGAILVALPPGPEQHLLMEQRIPHEIMHILIYQATGQAYGNLPAWLVEGLASISELYPNPDYQLLLEDAYRRNTLLPIASLCQVFPRDAYGALLAYAQATSFTRFLHQQHGTPGLEKLVSQYASGLDCERGAEQALDLSLSRLETQWRRDTFAKDSWLATLEEMLPWLLVLLVALLAPAGLALIQLRNRGKEHGE